ncbi:MAG: multidrug transporter, partial [Cyanobacteria bacterium P01_F01_bin.153]
MNATASEGESSTPSSGEAQGKSVLNDAGSKKDGGSKFKQLKFKAPNPKVTVFFVGALALIGVGSLGFGAIQNLGSADSADAEEEVVSPTRLQVKVVRAKTGLAQQWVFDEGVVTAERRRVLNFEAEGDVEYITKVDGRDLREGDNVRKGQLLATIDARKQNVDIETAEADLEVSVREQNQALAALAQAKADLDKDQSDLRFNEAELVRYQELFDEGVVSASDRDVYVNAAEKARAQLRVSQEGVRVAVDDVRVAKAAVDASQARLRKAKVNREDTELVSPINGVVAYINIREGEYWDGQITNSASTIDDLTERAPIVVIDPQSFEVEVEL